MTDTGFANHFGELSDAAGPFKQRRDGYIQPFGDHTHDGMGSSVQGFL